MLVKKHIIYSFIFSLLLFVIFPTQVGLIGAGIIFLFSIVIDTDHYIYYIFKNKSWNLKKSIRYFKQARKKRSEMPFEKRKKYYASWCFLHGIETLVVLFFLGMFVHRYFYFVLVGAGFHLFLDFIEQIQIGGRIDKISLIYDYLKYKKLKRI